MADTKLSDLAAATDLADADKSYLEQSGVSKSIAASLKREKLVGPGFHILDISSLREIGLDTANEISNLASHGGILSADTTPRLIRANLATDKALKVEWIGGNVDEVQFPPVPMAPFLDEAADVTIHLLAKMSAAGDVPTIGTVGTCNLKITASGGT
ncbi:hypothetical protein LCGC14_2910870, partial [marine sediment metagenome]